MQQKQNQQSSPKCAAFSLWCFFFLHPRENQKIEGVSEKGADNAVACSHSWIFLPSCTNESKNKSFAFWCCEVSLLSKEPDQGLVEGSTSHFGASSPPLSRSSLAPQQPSPSSPPPPWVPEQKDCDSHWPSFKF